MQEKSFLNLEIIKEYAKNHFQGRGKNIQRRGFSYDGQQIKDQTDESARQYTEENIDELCTKGWFNDLVQQEFQNQLVQFKNMFGNPKNEDQLDSFKLIVSYQNSIIESEKYYKSQNMKRQYVEDNIDELCTKGWFNDLVQQEFQNQLVQFKNSFGNPKNEDQLDSIKLIVQYQNSILESEKYYKSQSINTYIELHPFDKSSANIQPRSNNNFQYTFSDYNDEFSQSLRAFNFNKKVYFSIKLLQENSNDDKFHHYQPNLGECSFTPINRQRQQSNFSQKCTSPKSSQNNILMNVNSTNYYHQNKAQNNQNNQATHNILILQSSNQQLLPK
ncbi:hypothetical protein ABPG72_020284 [Tetrahymena utriculariae]